ncbi:MAG: hypothetical protein KDN19_18460 [Verrucomicrobiae bacterium]|nr:hypothetical protein [Verrucomicrobiae bacterium]
MNGFLSEVCVNHDVEFAGSLPGRQPGLIIHEDGRRTLVTEGPILPKPEKGDCSTILNILEGTLGTKQAKIFMAALRESVRSFRSGDWQQSQAIILAGPINSNKSLIIRTIYVPMLGGRAVNAYPYFIGSTEFNGEFLRAEVLVVDDDVYRSEATSRARLGAHIKKVTMGSFGAQVHPKGKEPLNITPNWRVIMALNDDPECLQLLPLLERSNADKYLLLKTNDYPLPLPADTPEEKTLLRAKLRKEYSAFAHFLLHEFEPPKDVVGGRTGVRPFLNPSLLGELRQFGPEAAVISILEPVWKTLSLSVGQEEPFATEEKEAKRYRWTGTAAELIRQVKLRDSDAGRALESLNKNGNQLGIYLKNLSHKFPDDICLTSRAGGVNRFEISLPLSEAFQ